MKTSRLLSLLLTVAALLAVAGPAKPATQTDPLQELYDATYLTMREMSAVLPHGSLYVSEGVLASLSGVDQRTAGVIVGDITLTMDKLPGGPGVLNLFAELNADEPAIVRRATQAFYSVAATAASKVVSGFPIAIRTWFELDPSEQGEFESVYLQAYSDGWIESGGKPGMGGGHWGAGGQPGSVSDGGVKPRFPVGEETFAAVWTVDGNRWDYRIDEGGENFTLTDYYRNITYVQQPWAPEEGQSDPAVHYSAINYSYAFWPHGSEGDPEAPGQLSASIEAYFSVSEPRAQIQLISYPWLEIESITDELLSELAFTRGGVGLSDWMVTVDGSFEPGVEHRLLLTADCTVPETYGGVGYAGVYRFDTAALWPGEDQPADIIIELAIEDNGWTILASGDLEPDYLQMGGPEGGYGPNRDQATAVWHGATRNQMLVATKFPSTTIPTTWGALEVYAPPELIDGVGAMESVTALGDIIAAYTSWWGDRDVATQPVFLVPGEHGVQAFEDAGLIFILGGDRSGIPLIAHETAHLWWGYDVSGPRWFFEGMANYGAARFLEHYYGEGGPAAGQGDPLFYRRYIMNFSLGYELPLSFDRRDAMDDTAAVYHNSAAFLMTCDDQLPGGLDPVLASIWLEQAFAPAMSHAGVRESFSQLGGEQLLGLWDSYVERGEIPRVEEDDPTFRRFEFTPGREDYVRMLRWLTPAYKKQAIGDYLGALYCAKRALDYRNEPKDYLLVAELTFRTGDLDIAWERCAALLENPETPDDVRVKLHWLLSRIYRAQGQDDQELLALEYVIVSGPAADLLYLVQQATERRAELTGEEPDHDAESAATPQG